ERFQISRGDRVVVQHAASPSREQDAILRHVALWRDRFPMTGSDDGLGLAFNPRRLDPAPCRSAARRRFDMMLRGLVRTASCWRRSIPRIAPPSPVCPE